MYTLHLHSTHIYKYVHPTSTFNSDSYRHKLKIGPMAPCSAGFLPDILRDVMPYNHLFKILTNMRNIKPKHVKIINIAII